MRQRSYWGWGWEDLFADREGRKNLGQQVGAMLGMTTGDVEDPVPLDSIRMPAPRVDAPASLASFASTETRDRAAHSHGRSYRDVVRGFYGDFSTAPDFVARPTDEAQVEQLLAWASGANVAVVPFGGGTSVVGGVEVERRDEHAGVVSLDLTAMDRVVEVDPVSHLATIQGGARGPVLNEQLAEQGFTLRHFPQSYEFSTLGGWVATRAGGHYATVRTHIDDLVASTRMITPSGMWQTRTLPGSGAGPSPDRLAIGSEGILGVITQAVIRVQRRPRYRSSASVHFSDWDAAVAATRELAQSGLNPANCRLLDKREAMLHMVSMAGTHVLLIGFESADGPQVHNMTRALEITASQGGSCEGATHKDAGKAAGHKGDAGAWRNAFINAPYLQNHMVSLGMIADTFETACTWTDFPALHAKIVGDVRDAMKRCGGKGFISCRFTHVYPDGPAPYYTFICPTARGSELSHWSEIKAAASDAIIERGGTITHHHAVGRMHKPWYDRQRPELFARALAAAKAELDPAGIMNPGVLIGQSEPMDPPDE